MCHYAQLKYMESFDFIFFLLSFSHVGYRSSTQVFRFAGKHHILWATSLVFEFKALCLHLPSPGITDVSYHVWPGLFIFFWNVYLNIVVLRGNSLSPSQWSYTVKYILRAVQYYRVLYNGHCQKKVAVLITPRQGNTLLNIIRCFTKCGATYL